MNALPWHPDRPLTTQDARAAIATQFPEVDSRTVKHLATGWEFDVYLTPDGWVFRFPRQGWIAGVFEPERRAHDLVAPVLAPIAVPKVELIGEPSDVFPHRFAGHRFISGVSADEASPHLEVTLASEIGRALEAIHSIPVQEARAAGVVELDMDDPGRKDWLQRGVDSAPRLRGLEPAIDPALDWLARLSLPIRGYDGPLCLVHTDLTRENLLVEPQTGRLTGILDWTDTFLEDAAGDLARLVMWRGWEFTEEVLRNYHRPIDQGFRDRISFAARLISTVVLTEAHAHSMDVAVYVNGVRNAFEAGALPNER
jgi:aminoglycoside phosphotransferase (APT) family kinase protein